MSEPGAFTYSGPALIGPEHEPGEIDGTFVEVGLVDLAAGRFRVLRDARLAGELAGAEPEAHSYLVRVEGD